jgi:hypothetical protein
MSRETQLSTQQQSISFIHQGPKNRASSILCSVIRKEITLKITPKNQ